MTTVELRQHIEDAFRIGMSQIPEEITALAEIIRDLNACIFLEIGTDRGGTFYLFCKLTGPDGKKITVDLPGGPYASMDSTQAAERNRQMRAWAENVHILEGNSHDRATRQKVQTILSGERCDFLFIDGDHTAKGVQMDYEMYRHLVRPGGYIFFHDIVDSENHRRLLCFVSSFWRRLRGDKRTICAGQDWGGIGVLKLPEKAGSGMFTRMLRSLGVKT